jgi:hypothetical protein
LRDHVVGGGIELGPEPVRGLDLVQEKIANLTLGNRPRILSSTSLQTSATC